MRPLGILGAWVSGKLRWRWYHAYLVLALLDLLTVSGSLFLTARLAWQSVEIFRARQEWSEIRDDLANLGRQVADVNLPGNDIFESGDVAIESARLRQAIVAFQQQAKGLRDKVSRQADRVAVSHLSDQLDDIVSSTLSMADTSQQVLNDFDHGDRENAARKMADMDRQHHGIARQSAAAEQHVASIQTRLSERHLTAIRSLQRLEVVIAALLVAMILGAVWYGLRNLREQRRMATALITANTELEARVAQRTADVEAALKARDRLLQGVFSAQEVERRRISRELHDGIGQQLATLLMQMQAQSAALDDDHCRTVLADMRRIVGEAIQEVRSLSQGLRPSVLDDIGLIPALERLVADVNQTGVLAVDLTVSEAPTDRLPEDIETAVYRIAQEAISNALKHSQAGRVHVELTCNAHQVALTVADDGRGFTAVNGSDGGNGLGLPGMHERASLLQGQLQIDSQPGRGTTVRAAIPLAATTA